MHWKVKKSLFFDVPRAFLLLEVPKDKIILMALWGEFVDIMCEVHPDLKKMSLMIRKEENCCI